MLPLPPFPTPSKSYHSDTHPGVPTEAGGGRGEEVFGRDREQESVKRKEKRIDHMRGERPRTMDRERERERGRERKREGGRVTPDSALTLPLFCFLLLHNVGSVSVVRFSRIKPVALPVIVT